MQTTFGIATVFYLCLGAAGAGLAGVACASFIKQGTRHVRSIKVGIWIALGFLICGIVCLVLDLGRPTIALNIFLFTNFDAWATRGLWLLLIAILSYTLLLVVISKTSSQRISSIWHAYKRYREIIALIFSWIVIVVSVLLALYTGFLLYDSVAIPFWRSPFLPVLFLLSSISVGLSLFAGITSALTTQRRRTEASGTGRGIVGAAAAAEAGVPKVTVLLLETVFLTAYLIGASFGVTEFGYFEVVKSSVSHLVFGGLSMLFWPAVIAFGMVIPLLIAIIRLTLYTKRIHVTLDILAMICAVIGLVALRYGIVFSGMSIY